MCNTICILQFLRMPMISDKKDTRVSFSYYFFFIPRVSISPMHEKLIRLSTVHSLSSISGHLQTHPTQWQF